MAAKAITEYDAKRLVYANINFSQLGNGIQDGGGNFSYTYFVNRAFSRKCKKRLFWR